MKNLYFILILLLSFTTNFYSQIKNYHHPFSGALGISAEGGFTLSQTDYLNSDLGYMVKGSAEYFFPSSTTSAFGFKFMGGLGTITGNDGNKVSSTRVNKFNTKLYLFGAGAEYCLSFGFVNPYVLGGGYYISFDPLDNAGNKLPRNAVAAYKTNEVNYTGEVGVKFLLSKSVSFNIAGAGYISPNDNLDDFAGGKGNDLYYSLTAGITFFVQPIRDSDNDGVDDDEDMCPFTPAGVKVDIFGCPIDSDKDGVPDYLDKCPNTPINVAVDTSGCPIDTDHDGVPDYLDNCPGTPPVARVDETGCPIDSDNDGVPDYKDRCPGTAAGVKVDSTGCPVVGISEKPKEEVNKVVLNISTNFDTGSSALTPNAKKILLGLVDVMKQNPQSKWTITGYTDNVGPERINKNISLKRASSVFIYFLSNGLSKDRFEVYGLGSQNPIGNNKLDFGRTINRRVEIVNKDYVKPPVPKQPIVPLENAAYDDSKDKLADNTTFSDGKLFAIQLSSWKTEKKADKEVKKLKKKGYNAFVFKFESPNKNETRYRVRIGYFNTLEDAEGYIEQNFGPQK
jgi:OOP family OmpA-OmpF porin